MNNSIPTVLIHSYWGNDLALVKALNPVALNFLNLSNDKYSREPDGSLEIVAAYSIWNGSIEVLRKELDVSTKIVVCIASPRKVFCDLESIKTMSEKGGIIILYKDHIYDPDARKWTDNPKIMYNFFDKFKF